MSRITLPSGTPAELVTPDGADRGLVVAPDIGGLRPLFDDHVERLAVETGWAVCAVEPFPGREDLTLEDRLGSMKEMSDERQLRDLVEGADATGPNQVGILGFCMGGMYAMKAAATGRFDRCVAFYGMIRTPEAWQGPEMKDALDSVTQPGAAPVLAVIGTADPWTPAADVDELEAAGATVVRYEGADHGFVHDPSRPTHRADDAADAWRRALAFLRGGSGT